MSTRKTKVKSSSTRRKANAKLGYAETNKNVNTLRKIEKANSDENEASIVMMKAQIIKGIKDGTISEYNKTLTADIRKQMVEYGYWWMKYKGVYPTVAPAGHLVAAGECQMKCTKRCAGYTRYLMTMHYGSMIQPACHACWTQTDLD